MQADQWKEVNAAFSKQSPHFDEDDVNNPIISLWRARIYNHVNQFLKPDSKILEINSGTGIDAIYFAQHGHHVHATDLSDGMINVIKQKVIQHSLSSKISVQQISFENLDQVQGKFDFLFSNFGGLNCCDDLTKVTRPLPLLLKPGGILTLVIMPPVTPWEWLWILKGKWKEAFRRFNSRGAESHLEGHHFLTYYFSLHQVQKAMPENFKFLKAESLGLISPPPSAIRFEKKWRGLTRFLNFMDCKLSTVFPFNRWGDHLILTFINKS